MTIKLLPSQRQKVERALENHEYLRSSYYWTPTGNAASRRSQERKFSMDISFTNAGTHYQYVSDVTISCRNFYYRGAFYVDGQKKTKAAFKRLIA